MTPVAEVLLTEGKGVFVADWIEITPGYVRARGRFRRRYGTAGAWTYSWGEQCERCWPWHRIHEVRQPAEEVAA